MSLYPVNYLLARGAYLTARYAARRYGPYLGHAAAVFAARQFRPMPRPYPGDRPVKRQRRMPPSSGGGGVMARSTVKSGRKKSKKAITALLTKSITRPIITRFQYVTNSYSGAGAFALDYTPSGTDILFPCYLMELTGAFANDIEGTTNYAVPFSRLQRSTVTNNYSTVAIPARDNDNTAALQYIWQVENPTAVSGQFGNDLFLQHVDMRFLLYGAKKTATTITLKLVRFTDPEQSPSVRQTTAGGAGTVGAAVDGSTEPTTGANVSEWNAFWAEQMAPYLGNPITTRPFSYGKKIDVVASKRFNFEPRLTIEDNGPASLGTGHQRIVKWFHKVSKSYSYLQEQNPADFIAGEDIIPQEYGRVGVNGVNTKANAVVHPKSQHRLFLMICAYTPVASNLTTQLAADVAPSFDMLIRRRQVYAD